MYVLKQIFTRALPILLLCFGASTELLGQDDIRKILPVPRADRLQGTSDSVYHDPATQTIDLFFEAWDGNQPFWDFNEQNLLVEETADGETLPLIIVFQGKVNAPQYFGEREVYQIKTRSEKNYHRGRRTYTLTWHSPGDKTKVIATLKMQKDWSLLGAFSLVEKYSFSDLLALCLMMLAVLLFILSELVPWIYTKRFISKYVFPYSQVQQQNERKLNPITGSPLQPDDRVVKMCNRDICCIPLNIWQRRNYQCYHCPERCDGNANIWTRRFFTQLGDARKLNWLWFGACGGALAWILSNVVLMLPEIASNQVANTGSFGLVVGLSYAMMLSLVEELGQGRGLSIGRLLLRVLMGATVGAALFFGVGLLGATPWLSALAWLLFCILLGLILSFQSSISLGRGVFSGLIAGLLSAGLYFGIPFLFPNPEADLVKMITLMTAGAILGVVIIQVVKQLDRVEIQVISPSYRSGLVFALDNFLRHGTDVIIGKDMKACAVRVKWEDEHVLGRHAVMKRAGNQVSIFPLADAELWIDGQRLTPGQSQKLRGGEIIALNRTGTTAFKYLQKS